MRKAVVLVSGGLDSATTLAIARAEGFSCYAISFDYGQRQRAELDAAVRVTAAQGVAEHRLIPIDLTAFGGSALTDDDIAVPVRPAAEPDVQTNEPLGAGSAIPVTYVPARNTVFLALSLAYAEVLGAQDIFIGVNAVDYSGYPDCRPEFIEAFTTLANLATKAGVEGAHCEIHTPLIELSKAAIIQRGIALGVDYGSTVSCYQPTAEGAACGACDSCRLRLQGFAAAGVSDPTRYV